jgi:hypothetical protein
MKQDRKKLLAERCSCLGQNPNCYKCGGWGYLDSVGKNRVLAGPVEPPVIRVKRKRRVREQVPCPQCGVLVARLSRHLRKVHAMQQNSITAGAPLPVRLDQSLAICPHCKCHVKSNRLRSHISRVHHGAPPKAVSRSRSSEYPVDSSNHPRSSSQLFDDHRMDVTRSYAHAYRDHGRFGSYPSHDDYGDEGEP